MTHSSTSISCSHLVFKRGARTILNDISFDLKKGALTALIGHNGAGKSTLLKLVLGLLEPFSGSLTVLGAAPGSNPLKVGYLPENVSFYDQMTVRDHLRYFSALKCVSERRVQELVEQLGLTEVIGQKLGQCSKGQRQRLGLAQALLTNPELLILDEPTVGLDPAASLLMYRELSRLRDEGCSVVVCTHELALVEHYLDNALVISRGLLAGAGTLDELRAQGMKLNGPLPADTLFQPKYLDNADAVLAMYHDQGLPVLKYQGFGRGVNITLGLPFIRTSVDHGTALELAGRGKADVGSFITALNLAIKMIVNTQ